MDSPDVRGLPKICEEGRLKVEPARENTYTAKQGGRDRGMTSQRGRRKRASLFHLLLTLDPG